MSARARVAWGLVALGVVLAGLHTWQFVTWAPVRQGSSGWPVLTVGAVLMATLGAVIVTRIPGHRIGWLFVVGGLSLAVALPQDGYAMVLQAESRSVPYSIGLLLAWSVTLFDLPVPGALLVLTFLLFPDGRLPSPRWRPLLWATVLTLAVFVVLVVAAARPVDIYLDTTAEATPEWVPVLYGVLVLCLLVEVLAAAASVVVRLRRAGGEERQQLLWLATAALFVAVGLVLAVGIEPLGLRDVVDDRLRTLPLHLAMVGVPLAAGLAVLRYRLYDIDLVLNRAIVLTALTAFVAAGYVAVVVTIGLLVGARAEGRFWPSLLATAAVAVAFQPLRRRVVRLADRLVYGARAAPYEALADFTAALDREPAPTDVTARLAEGIGRTVGARRVTVELDLPDLAGAGASWRRAGVSTGRGAGSGVETRVAVTDREAHLGTIGVVTDRALPAAHRHLVEHLARQGGAALRNAHLQAELAARVAELERQARDLEQARRDVLAARDRERARLSVALDRRVVAHLRGLPEELARLAEAMEQGPEEAERVLGRHREEVGRALEELRRLTRGLMPVPGPRTPVPR